MRTVQADEVAKKVAGHESFFILDVRNEEAYAECKIEGEQIRQLNVPYFDLLDGVEEEIAVQLPKDEEILVICAKEGSSIMVAEILEEEGFQAAYLAGGMKTWNE